jgi:hypothetical protein
MGRIPALLEGLERAVLARLALELAGAVQAAAAAVVRQQQALVLYRQRKMSEWRSENRRVKLTCRRRRHDRHWRRQGCRDGHCARLSSPFCASRGGPLPGIFAGPGGGGAGAGAPGGAAAVGGAGGRDRSWGRGGGPRAIGFRSSSSRFFLPSSSSFFFFFSFSLSLASSASFLPSPFVLSLSFAASVDLGGIKIGPGPGGPAGFTGAGAAGGLAWGAGAAGGGARGGAGIGCGGGIIIGGRTIAPIGAGKGIGGGLQGYRTMVLARLETDARQHDGDGTARDQRIR